MNQKQSYENHRRLDPWQHFLLSPISLVTFIITIVYTIQTAIKGTFSLTHLLLLLLAFQMIPLGIIARRNALVAQDRAIRAEEQLRHFILTGQALDQRLSIKQIVALRFASDEELPSLAQKAAEGGWSPNEIKKTVQTWRADTYRV